MNYKNIIFTSIIFLLGISVMAQEQKEINLESFTEVNFEGSAQWILVPSDVEKLIIESDNKDVFKYIDHNLKGGVLTINTTDKNTNLTKLFKSVTIKVYFKSIESVSLSGVGSVKTEEMFQSKELTATLKGTGNMHLKLQCSNFNGYMHGTGALFANGTSDKSIVRVEGVGSFEGYDFITTDMNVTVSGVGGAKVFATNNLTATINGVGSIRYKGDPETKNLNTNGLGSIKRAN